MNAHRLWLAAGLAAALVGLSQGNAYAGGAVRATNLGLAQLGARSLQPVPTNLPKGSIVQLEVVDPTKLAKFGVAGAKRGDRFKVVVVEPGKRFSLEVGQQKRLLLLDQQGVLKLAPGM